MNNTTTKSLEINRFDSLDNISRDEVSEFMEQYVPKHSVESRNWVDKYPYHPVTIFSMCYSKDYIYIDFFVRGNYLRAVNYTNNSPVCEDSCVECFLSVPGSGEYWNFEFNCIGTINASHRKSRDSKIPLTRSEERRVGKE